MRILWEMLDGFAIYAAGVCLVHETKGRDFDGLEERRCKMTREEYIETLKQSIDEMNGILKEAAISKNVADALKSHIDACSLAVDGLLEVVDVADTYVGKINPQKMDGQAKEGRHG